MKPPKVAILWRGDAETRQTATSQNNRFHRIFEELEAVGIEAVPAVYDEAFADDLRSQLLGTDGVLVWVNPLQDGKSRRSLNNLLADVAAVGPWVSAHPDAIQAMGTKEILFRTKHLGWGTDTKLYGSRAQLRDEFPGVLAARGARVLKQARGNDGHGVWKVEPVSSGSQRVRVMEAAVEGVVEEMSLDDFLTRCEGYMVGDGFIVDQPFQERLSEGMVRCYMAAEKVAGFAHQYPKGLLPPGHVRPHAEKRMFAPDEQAFALLRREVEDLWVPQMIAALELDRRILPVIWDADFLYGPRTGAGEDTFVLCEVNVSSVFAIPDDAPAAIAKVVSNRFRDRS
ncbi:Cj0069 family protein [Tardiphaga sp. 813_E8_N1_3]|uniref:Cj0069 family protein n=1 Tax=Tardiphaga sp. 813_E8_N1_3 TaxID=3240760 RepID=UPI003F2006E8